GVRGHPVATLELLAAAAVAQFVPSHLAHRVLPTWPTRPTRPQDQSRIVGDQPRARTRPAARRSAPQGLGRGRFPSGVSRSSTSWLAPAFSPAATRYPTSAAAAWTAAD